MKRTDPTESRRLQSQKHAVINQSTRQTIVSADSAASWNCCHHLGSVSRSESTAKTSPTPRPAFSICTRLKWRRKPPAPKVGLEAEFLSASVTFCYQPSLGSFQLETVKLPCPHPRDRNRGARVLSPSLLRLTGSVSTWPPSTATSPSFLGMSALAAAALSLHCDSVSF